MRRALFGWWSITVCACVLTYFAFLPGHQPPVPETFRPWLKACLAAVRTGQAFPQRPAEVSAHGPVASGVLEVWHRGQPIAEEEVSGALGPAVERAFEAIAGRGAFATAIRHRQKARAPDLYATLTLPTSEGPMVTGVPWLAELGIVALRDGVSAELAGRRVWVTPHRIWATGLLDRAIKTPIPDLTFGVQLDVVIELLAGRLGVSKQRLLEQGTLRRVSAVTVAPQQYPMHVADPRAAVSSANLRAAALEGARFLLRHQKGSGRFAYVYDGASAKVSARAGYNWARHAGTAFFLAQVAHQLGDHNARRGAIKALGYVRQHVLTHCGAREHACVAQGKRARLGASALTALAAAELLRSGASEPDRNMLEGLKRHMHAVQRPDGELMHDFDLSTGKPIDVQRMYYSGEAALALLADYRTGRNPEDLKVVTRLMAHLTGAGWDFFGSRYFYGEEHWTCQAVAEAHRYMELPDALLFCLRWTGFQSAVQYRAPRSPWPVTGTYGVGPLFLPRLTAVAARVEAGAPVYREALARGHEVAELRAQMSAAVGALLRHRWAPGPVHMLGNPLAAAGGFPATQGSLRVRNDYVQHAGSAMLAWAQVLQDAGE